MVTTASVEVRDSSAEAAWAQFQASLTMTIRAVMKERKSLSSQQHLVPTHSQTTRMYGPPALARHPRRLEPGV
jgi:hypothetical protein